MTGAHGHIELERAIDSIRVGARHRTDLGDVDELAASIERQGLLQPITVTPDGDLVCGARRLAALRKLGVRTLSVWVRSGISDGLARLLAEQDDNALHKPLAPTEAAGLYREVKQLLAEDAKRRQAGSRFHSGVAQVPGAAPGAAPQRRGDGDARAQAAQLVTGNRSYNTHERIGELQRIAADEDAAEEQRAEAARALAAIDAGAPVKPLLRAVTGAPELERLAQDALARVRAERRSKRRGRQAQPTNDTAEIVKLPIRAFVLQWSDLQQWWFRFDAEKIAADLTDSQLEEFEATVAGTVEFLARIRALRRGTRAVAL
ncbi:chromosome partitioning protein ParB [Agromyces sp. CFH 90414]|uniref:Chromosome partitioning protein ParB n=1 Tax=Agromyces agglutinans TaxID=2662258 RepID=A0A6I2F073_9MICO|nr:ParB N-terminal domain-containing protein [Agromyces agglutinans]MRG58795.1 chromosome partitioning protein ParB [Agromyces agglutinans]